MADGPGITDRSTETIGAGWYAVALVVYVAAGYYLKSWLLNWIVGPLFLVVVLYVVPTAVRRLRRALQR